MPKVSSFREATERSHFFIQNFWLLPRKRKTLGDGTVTMARILIVEDSKELQDITKMTLEFNGHEAVTADNGKEGLAAAASGPFDLILSDIAMPVMDGLDFMRRFRAEYGGATPIIALTAESGDIAATAREAGATGYIPKPFQPIELLEAIGEYLA